MIWSNPFKIECRQSTGTRYYIDTKFEPNAEHVQVIGNFKSM